ncbi:hypothetical protein MAR_029525, partial [Mya arenaria]
QPNSWPYEEGGCLLFVQAGSEASANDLWEDATLAADTDMYGHQRTIAELMNVTNFRSPLIDQWDTLGLYWVELEFYNQDGLFLRRFEYSAAVSSNMSEVLNSDDIVMEPNTTSTYSDYEPTLWL